MEIVTSPSTVLLTMYLTSYTIESTDLTKRKQTYWLASSLSNVRISGHVRKHVDKEICFYCVVTLASRFSGIQAGRSPQVTVSIAIESCCGWDHH